MPRGGQAIPLTCQDFLQPMPRLPLTLERLEGAGLSVGPVDLRATLTRGRLVFDVRRIDALWRRLSPANSSSTGATVFRWGGDLLLAGVQLEPLLTDPRGPTTACRARAVPACSFLGVGNDMATIMSGLDGEGDLSFGAGVDRGSGPCGHDPHARRVASRRGAHARSMTRSTGKLHHHGRGGVERRSAPRCAVGRSHRGGDGEPGAADAELQADTGLYRGGSGYAQSVCRSW